MPVGWREGHSFGAAQTQVVTRAAADLTGEPSRRPSSGSCGQARSQPDPQTSVRTAAPCQIRRSVLDPTRLLDLCDEEDLRDADPDTFRTDLAHPRPPRITPASASSRSAPTGHVEGRDPYLLAAALRPASTHLNSTNHPSCTKEDNPGAVGAGCSMLVSSEFASCFGSRQDYEESHEDGIMTSFAGGDRARIFISYRRQDTAYPAARLFDRLVDHFGRNQVFKDVDSLGPGDNFTQVINDAIGSCGVLLALIGRRWLTITADDGRRRLDNPGDLVRMEIETALGIGVGVIPLLLDGARMPPACALPGRLARLPSLQVFELSPSRQAFRIDDSWNGLPSRL